MIRNGTLYTLAVWTVKPGNDAAFVKAWDDFALWTSAHQEGAGTAVLVQDVENPLRFISFGSWPDKDVIVDWRGSAGFKKAFASFRELCSDIQPHIMQSVASAGKG